MVDQRSTCSRLAMHHVHAKINELQKWHVPVLEVEVVIMTSSFEVEAITQIFCLIEQLSPANFLKLL